MACLGARVWRGVFETVAQVLALARKMQGGRARNDILDSAYHRYAFHDDNLPRWLYEDEKRHMRCALHSILRIIIPGSRTPIELAKELT